LPRLLILAGTGGSRCLCQPHLYETSRTQLVPLEEVEKYEREHLGRRGKRMLPDEALTEKQRKQRACQRAYYQRRKAAQQQQPVEPAE
jgi:hypothetical protein